MSRCTQCHADVVDRVGDVCGACAATVFAGVSAANSAAPFAGPLPIGAVLAEKWRIEGLLGHGGMGVVLRAHDMALGRTVAVKFLAEHLCVHPDFVARFEREAQLTARLVHPNIVHVYDVGRYEGRPFLVMQHLEGLPLSDYLRSQPSELTSSEVLAIARQLCAGLEFIHSRGFVHRDIKPANLFIAAEGHLTLLDFGVLKPSTGVEETGSGSRIGTRGYMAPEQLRGEPVDARTDLFAAAIVLSEVAGGCRAPAELAKRAPWVPAAVREVLSRATAEAPVDRFASAAELLAELETAYASSARPANHVMRAARTPAGSRRTAFLGMGVAVAIAVGAAAFFAAPSSQGTTASARATESTGASTAAEPPAATPPSASPSAAANPLPPADALGPPRTTVASTVAPKRTETSERPAQPRPRAATAKKQRTTPAEKTGSLRIVTLHGAGVTWANVHVNGRSHETPVTIQLPAGIHVVRVERQGFRAVERTVRVSADTRALVRVELER